MVNPEIRDKDVERAVGKRQRLRIALLKADAGRAARASAIIAAEKSSPVTNAPRPLAVPATNPGPQARSSTRNPVSTRAASSKGPIKPLVARAKVVP